MSIVLVRHQHTHRNESHVFGRRKWSLLTRRVYIPTNFERCLSSYSMTNEGNKRMVFLLDSDIAIGWWINLSNRAIEVRKRERERNRYLHNL